MFDWILFSITVLQKTESGWDTSQWFSPSLGCSRPCVRKKHNKGESFIVSVEPYAPAFLIIFSSFQASLKVAKQIIMLPGFELKNFYFNKISDI